MGNRLLMIEWFEGAIASLAAFACFLHKCQDKDFKVLKTLAIT